MRPTLLSTCLVLLLAGGDGSLAASIPALALVEQARESLCGSLDEAAAARARRLAPLGEPARTALVALAGSGEPGEVLCGVAGLTALGDRRVIPHLVTAVQNPALRGEVYRLARWATFMAGGPETDLGTALLPVAQALDDPVLWAEAGHDAIWLLGEIDHPWARDRLLEEFSRSLDDAARDAVAHALARQGEPRARERMAALGAEALRGKSGNATPEQARRLGEVAFYQLALEPQTVPDGLELLGTIAVRDQAWVAAWAVHSLCARAVRRPAERDAIETHRQALVAELDRRGVSWQEPQGSFGCEAGR